MSVINICIVYLKLNTAPGEGTPLFKGQIVWSGGCPLLGGNIVYKKVETIWLV